MNHEAYCKFVEGVTSNESKNFNSFMERLNTLHKEGIDVPALLTGTIGLSSESGEFSEIVKKIIFQGKEWSPDVLYHLKRELGDIQWYIAQILKALNTDLNTICNMNVDKLKDRYPEGFDAYMSENRKEGDI